MPLQTLLDTPKPGSDIRLLLPREEVAFLPSPGNFTQMYSETNLPPELATHISRDDSGILSDSKSGRKGALLGYVSGERSGLIPAGNRLFHLKGCRPSRGRFKDHVDGTQSVQAAERELRFLGERVGKA